MARLMKVTKPTNTPSRMNKRKRPGEADDDEPYRPHNQEKEGSSSQRATRPLSQPTVHPQASQALVTVEQQPNTAGARLRLALDIGTTWTKAAFQFSNADDRSNSSQIWPVAWESNGFQTPSTVSYQKGKLLWGADLERALSDGEVTESVVLRQFKLALHSDASVEDVKDKVLALSKQENKSVFDLFADYLSELVAYAKDRIFTGNSRGLAFDPNIPLEIIVSVPQCWDPASNIALVEAAKQLGSSCTVVGEALCASAFIWTKEIDVSAEERWLKPGDMVLVLDLGGGTGDFVLIELGTPVINGPLLAMRVVLPATGYLCGSVFINKAFTAWLQNEHFPAQPAADNFNVTWASLGLRSGEEFLARASISFDLAKAAFPMSKRYSVQVIGMAGFRHSWSIPISKEQMAKFFDPVIKDIDEQVEVMLANPEHRQSVKCMILTGGLGKSEHIIKHMRDKWERIGIKVVHPLKDYTVPVPRGALLRYNTNAFESLGHNWSLGVIRNEAYNPEDHPDVLRDETDSKRDPVDSSVEVVEDRITWIKNATTGKIQHCWSLREPEVGQEIVLKAEIFMSTSKDIVDHQSAFERNSDVLRPGIVRFRTIEHTVHNPSKQGWAAVTGDNGEQVYQIYTCVVVRISGDFIRFGFKVVPAHEETIDDQGDFVEELDDSAILWDDSEFKEIWNRNFSHVAREMDGQ